MPYEPASSQCLGLISAKDNILSAITSLKSVDKIDHIRASLKKLYQELDEIHERRKLLENEV